MTENLERRNRILQAARDIFAREGFRDAEVKTIAKQAGVGKATIYKHFESKDDILLKIVEENFHALRNIAIQNLVGGGHPFDRLEKTCLAMAKFLSSNKAFSKVLIKEAGEFMPEIQKLHATVVEANAQFADAFFDVLKDQQIIPDIPNQTLLELLMNLTIGTVYAWTLNDERDLEEDVKHLFDLWRDRLPENYYDKAK